jgi:hypothetical protein
MGTTHQVFSGSGFSSLEPIESPLGSPGATGYDFKPVARWDELPAQIFREDNIYIGLLAYHSEGIKEVEFILNGGEGVLVTEEEINPMTGIPEYFVKINRDDVLTNMDSGGESFMNVELRAIVRPNVGQVRILQHDIEAVKGSALTNLVLGLFGVSGGGFSGPNDTNIFMDERLHPGEHSYFCSLLKNNDTSDLSDIIKFIGTSGNDLNDGSRENPVRTMDKCLELIRDEAVSRGWTYEYEDKYYADTSTGVVTFLAGQYDGSYYHCENAIGNRTLGNEVLSAPNGFLIVTGDPLENNEAVVFYTPEEDKLPIDPETNEPYAVADQNNPNSFNLGRSNSYISLLILENLTILREHSGFLESNFSYYTNDINASIKDGTIYYYTCNLFKNLIFDLRTLGKEASTLWAGTAFKYPAFVDCKTYGGKQTYQYATWLRSCYLYKNVADNMKQFAHGVGCRIIDTDASFAFLRRIYFDPNDSKTQPYTKFNGLYAAIRDWEPITGTTAFSGQDWFLDPRFFNEEQGRTRDRLTTATGTIWMRIKEEEYLNLDSGIFRDKKTNNPATFTYNELGISYGIADGEYFGNTTDLEPPCVPNGVNAPFLRKEHAITPEREERLVWGYDGDNDIIGDMVYDTFYGDYCMALLTSSAGEEHAGFCLFDRRKPLVYGPDENPDTQRFLFRLSGSTGYLSNEEGENIGHFRPGGTGNFAIKGTDNSKPFYYSWSEGTADTEPPRGGHFSPPDTIEGSTNDDYPIHCYANSGTDDATHADQLQWFIEPSQSDNFNGIIRIENIITAYNLFMNMYAQPWNIGDRDAASTESWLDMAFVNNVIGTKAFNYGRYSASCAAPIKNLLMFNNTIGNGAFNFRAGDLNYGPTFGGVTGQKYLNADNCDSWSSYMQEQYPNGITTDQTSGHFVFRNNYVESFAGSVFGVLYNEKSPQNSGVYDETLGLTFTYPVGSTQAISHPCIFEDNYMWAYGTENRSVYIFMDKIDIYKEMGQTGPGFKNHPVPSGGATFDPSLPYDYEPHPTSSLVGGSSTSVPYDIFYRKRPNIGNYTVGAIESSTGFSLENDVFNTASGFTSSSTTINLPDDNKYYGKVFKVRALRNATTQYSDNTYRFNSRHKIYPYEDPSLENQYEMVKEDSFYEKSSYNTTTDSNTPFSTEDWLSRDYGVDAFTIYGSLYGGTPDGISNYWIISFYNGDENGNTRANTFKNVLDASSESLCIDLIIDGEPVRHCLDKGSGFVNSSTYRSYLNRGSEGETFDIPVEILPETGILIINKPNDM